MEGQETKSSDGLNRASLLAMTLDKPVLARVLKHLSPKELTRLMSGYEAAITAGRPDGSKMASVGKIFLSSEPAASASTFKDALVMAYGEDNADQILRQDQWRTISERVKPETFAAVLRDERPQAVAMALSQLPPRFAADVLGRLPEELRAEAVDNLAYAESAPRSALDAILRAVEESFSGKAGSEEGNQKAGAKRAAAMLNQLDSDSATAIVAHIRNRDAKRASAIEDEMFHFADLLNLDNRSLQAVLAEIRPERIALALKGITDDQKTLVFAALPEQVKVVVDSEMSESGRVPAREVKAARRELTEMAINLDRQGKIHIHGEEESLD
jgi:flagellar motor switch protein FliG